MQQNEEISNASSTQDNFIKFQTMETLNSSKENEENEKNETMEYRYEAFSKEFWICLGIAVCNFLISINFI